MYNTVVANLKKMKSLIRKYIIQKWWIPTISFFLSVFLFFFASYLQIPNPYFIGVIGFLFLVIAGIIQLFNKKWLAGILNLGISFCVVFVIGIFAFAFMTMFGLDNDTFTDNLELPKNVKLNYPIDLLSGEDFEYLRPTSETERKNIDFQLYNSFQPGLYEYDFWTDSNLNGTVYLKVYEITQEVQLSESRLRERSSIRIENANGKLKKFGTNDHFTIYEGDWGKPYGARFEIWFKPENGEKENKVFEKNYIIEGWMR